MKEEEGTRLRVGGKTHAFAHSEASDKRCSPKPNNLKIETHTYYAKALRPRAFKSRNFMKGFDTFTNAALNNSTSEPENKCSFETRNSDSNSTRSHA